MENLFFEKFVFHNFLQKMPSFLPHIQLNIHPCLYTLQLNKLIYLEEDKCQLSYKAEAEPNSCKSILKFTGNIHRGIIVVIIEELCLEEGRDATDPIVQVSILRPE